MTSTEPALAPTQHQPVLCPRLACDNGAPLGEMWRDDTDPHRPWRITTRHRPGPPYRTSNPHPVVHTMFNDHNTAHHDDITGRSAMLTASAAAHAVIRAARGLAALDEVTTGTCRHCDGALELRDDHWLDLAGTPICGGQSEPCQNHCQPHDPESPTACGECHGFGFVHLSHEAEVTR